MTQWFKDLHEFEVTYNHGFGDVPCRVFAHNLEEAKKVGLAEFRKNTGFVESVDKFSLEEVISNVSPIIG